MADLPEPANPTFRGVYQLETSDPVIAGPSGIVNRPFKELVERTAFLKGKTDSLETDKATVAALNALIGRVTTLEAGGSMDRDIAVLSQDKLIGVAWTDILSLVLPSLTSKKVVVDTCTYWRLVNQSLQLRITGLTGIPAQEAEVSGSGSYQRGEPARMCGGKVIGNAETLTIKLQGRATLAGSGYVDAGTIMIATWT